MKKIVLAVVATFLIFVSFAQDQLVSSAGGNAGFHWANTSFDFGKIKAGIPVSYEFRFTNTGITPLIISSVKASCGCTVTAYTKDPVEKNASGFVRATYDAAETGKFSKTVTVYSNSTEGMVQLTIKGEVVR